MLLLSACAPEPTAVEEPQTMLTDETPVPPVRVEVESPSGEFILALSTADRWQSRKATAELFEIEAGARKRLWSRVLPQDLGPRFAFVDNDGRVALLDEWINVASRFAVMILDRDDQVVVQRSFDDVAKALGMSSKEILAQARHGMWISSPPILDPTGDVVRVGAGGKTLVIRLSDGDLSIEAGRIAR